MHARARTASVADASGHVVARAPPLTPLAPLCAKRSTTPPCAAQTMPLDRGNAVADAHLADVRRGYCRSRHAMTVILNYYASQQQYSWDCDMEPNEPINTKFYQLGNGGSLIFEHDLDSLSDHLGRPHPEFHGIQVDDQPGGELQWIITADLRGKMEPPTSERILFSFRESNWLDGLARALQEALARLCGQNVEALREERFAHLARRNSDGRPMDVPLHPQLRHHVDHLDFMLYQTQRDLDATRAYANQTHAHITEQGEAIKLLNNDRKSLRQQRAKKDATIRRLRARIASLEATVQAQEDQLNEMEEEGEDLQGGDAFLSDDDDFEEDENTEEEDYEFLEAGEDGIIPIDVDDDEE
ncbi:hypothetical protein QYE76_006048 [Lolium multiflorum]|uniref:Uncharacterized protein n=1 Tax=Lolium multiflorum TaxID=4521 RepID=A0AAD8RV45_LOLMU|nr:hypothetical protein QYE76_006048 [Lolium multiflorum]